MTEEVLAGVLVAVAIVGAIYGLYAFASWCVSGKWPGRGGIGKQ